MEKSSSTVHSSSSTYNAEDPHLQSKMKQLQTLNSALLGLNSLSLLMGLTILGVSANTLKVHHRTSLPEQEYFISLWPEEFNIRPTVALVAGSVFVVLSNVISLVCGKLSSMRSKQVLINTTCAIMGLIAALVAVILFYAVNASESVDTFTSWTCRWKHVAMSQEPHWGTLCEQSYAALYLGVLLIPLEVVSIGLGVWIGRLGGYVERYEGAKKSPALS
ncbi:hypothetical protein QBC38DRAFT_482735 [Podospora fimiseda]|uniref:Uncharacterized protein n=1 Tax=Podospora fimiseda TaxID=252190 RepID=A0AAN7BLJ6_9PEZI|nr:hypothetical protein QBC38DRAFT_482735 [Podospora fimiseda]